MSCVASSFLLLLKASSLVCRSLQAFWHLYDLATKHQYTGLDVFNLHKAVTSWRSWHTLAYKWARPKTHALLHLPALTHRLGPLRGYWTFGFESRYNTVKAVWRSENKKTPGKYMLHDIAQMWSARNVGGLGPRVEDHPDSVVHLRAAPLAIDDELDMMLLILD